MSGSGSNKGCFNNAKDFSRMMRGGNISLRSGGSSVFNHTVSLRIIHDQFLLPGFIRIIAQDGIPLIAALLLAGP